MNLDVPRFTIFAQIHYPDIWDEMIHQLDEKVDVPFALVMSCPDEKMALALPKSSHLRFVKRISTENRGRDILPFLTCLHRLKDQPLPDICLKLHTKKSPHREDGLDWRNTIVLSLLEANSPGLPGLAALDLMEADSRIGLIAPRHHLMPIKGRIWGNRMGMRHMADQIGIDLDPALTDEARFPAGSMFWFRRAALSAFAQERLDDLFEPEAGKLDATMAHATERLFAVASERRGFLALPMESVRPIGERIEQDGSVPLNELAELVRESEMFHANSFISPLPQLIQRHERVMIVAHFLYRRLPKPLWRAGRTLVKCILRPLEKAH